MVELWCGRVARERSLTRQCRRRSTVPGLDEEMWHRYMIPREAREAGSDVDLDSRETTARRVPVQHERETNEKPYQH
jgi:hypothetical protein